MNDISAVQHDERGKAGLTELWVSLSGRPRDFDTEEWIARSELLHTTFESHLRTAAAAFRRLGLFAAREIEESAVQGALRAILEQFRAYRTYATGLSTEPPPGAFFETALEAAHQQLEPFDHPALDFIAATMSGEMGRVRSRGAPRRAPVQSIGRTGCRQSRGRHGFFSLWTPAVAQRCRVLSGGVLLHGRRNSRRVRTRGCRTFRTRCLRPRHTTTSAAKTFARVLAVLSEFAEDWEAEVRQWFEMNTRWRGPAIDAGDEYQLYQTLVSTWPADLNSMDCALDDYTRRILQWREKSLREAKLRTSWTAPDREFEATHAEFVKAILDAARSRRFLSSLVAFTSGSRWQEPATVSSSASCAARCPGVPDLYQGCEFWDLSLVDPDNRRAIDFDSRREALASADEPAAILPRWQNSRVKQALIARLLGLRRKMPECFAEGSYEPLAITGARAAHVIAFERAHIAGRVLVAVPRLCARACAQNGLPNPSPEFWKNTASPCRAA
jgi:(1->4)-alpha-D-glucan 1-alpha-D-glucosylmutase